MPILLLIFLFASWLPAYSRPQWTPVSNPIDPDDFRYDRNSIKRTGDITSVNITYTAKDKQVKLFTWNYDCKLWMYSHTSYSPYVGPKTDRLRPIPPDTRAEAVAEIVCPK